jgi:hypothetical protein
LGVSRPRGISCLRKSPPNHFSAACFVLLDRKRVTLIPHCVGKYCGMSVLVPTSAFRGQVYLTPAAVGHLLLDWYPQSKCDCCLYLSIQTKKLIHAKCVLTCWVALTYAACVAVPMEGPRLCNTVVCIHEQVGSVFVPCMLVICNTVDTLY